MTQPILKLQNLNKTFVLGRSKNARRALRSLQKLQARYEAAHDKQDTSAAGLAKKLEQAQSLFNNEQYNECYSVCTGKRLKKRDDDGLVVHALRGVDLSIMPGELVAIVGPSGSGKSTLLNMLGLLDDPTAGRIYLRGRNVTAIKHRELPDIRSHELGFVFQAFNLVTTLTALENVMLPLKYAKIPHHERRAMAGRALRRVGLADRMHHMPNELSGGQQQRVAIARAIVGKPAIVFGDELTGELDSAMTAEIMTLIKQLNRAGQTFIIVTHNVEVARNCKRILYMRDGRIERDRQVPQKAVVAQPVRAEQARMLDTVVGRMNRRLMSLQLSRSTHSFAPKPPYI